MTISLMSLNACAFQLFTTITVNEPAPGLKAIFSFKVPDQRSGKVRDTQPFCITILINLMDALVKVDDKLLLFA